MALTKYSKIGLVLSGGGAKGAYQAGTIKALAEFDINPSVISGASIGALNGAIISTSMNTTIAADSLKKLWTTLAEQPPLKLNETILKNIPEKAKQPLKKITIPPSYLVLLTAFANELHNPGGLFSNRPISKIINELVPEDKLDSGIPLWVSLYKSHGGIFDFLNYVLAELTIKNTHDSEFFMIQDLPKNDQKNTLLATAALPLFFSAKQVQGQKYSDGGQGGSIDIQGNTPITPLLDEGCDLIIVSHLSDASLWDRNKFKKSTKADIIELRPRNNISREGPIRDLLGFNSEMIYSWMEQGYNDSIETLNDIMEISREHHELQTSLDDLTLKEVETKSAFDSMKDELRRPF